MRGLSQSSINRQQHIPTPIRQAMDQHVQRTMPAHLQRQMNDGVHMSSQAQRAVNEHLQQTVPAHLKQYAGAYMEQQVLSPNTAVPAPGTVTAPQPHAPVPDRMRLDHSNVSAAQYDAKFHANLFAPDSQAPPPAPEQPAQPPQPATAPPPAGTDPNSPDYGFIMQPPKPPRRGLPLPRLPSNGPPVVRIAIILGGLLVLLILFVIIKGLLSGGGNTAALTAVAQDQQEMIHILTNGAGTSGSQQQAVLSSDNQNFAATAQVSLTSAQSQLLTYMKNNGKKVSTKALSSGVSPSIDQQLTTAAGNSTYDSTFKGIMQTQLKNYETAINTAYKQTSGTKGRQLLIEEYNGAQLLLTQLNSPSN